MCLNQLAKKGYIMDSNVAEQKVPKPYMLSANGIKFVEEYVPKDKGDNKGTGKRCRKKEVKKKSKYTDLDLDQLNLEKYPSVSDINNFKDQMILLMYIITEEGKGEWFSTADILCVMTDLFGEPLKVNLRRKMVKQKESY